jgi:TolB-like protein/Flp pilus assembly protein TadD
VAENAKTRFISIDLNQFKLHVTLKNRIELTLYFNSPSRRFYLSVIAFVVNEMKRQGKITSIPLEGHHDFLALLNETVGGSAGSSDKENLLPRIYRKWQHALPNLEEAPLFKVLGRKKEYDEGTGKAYPFTEAEKDSWANLFEYKGSEENVRLRFAIDKIGAGLEDVDIIYEDSLNGDAWDKFISSLKGKIGTAPELETTEVPPEVPEAPSISLPMEHGTVWLVHRRWIAVAGMIVVIAGAATLAFWKLYSKAAPFKSASLERMAFPLPDRPSIAVFPFVNMSDDPKQELFCDGLTEEIITTLSKSPYIFVIARTSTFAYRGKQIRVDKVAEELGVRFVLEGSVRRAGERMRVNAQLVDATTGHHLWAEQYDGTLNDVFALEDEITEKIVTALAVKLTVEERETAARRETRNVAAYEEFLKGWERYLRFRSDDLAGAVQSFKKATELDPNYQRAYAALALTYWSGSNIGIVRKGLGVPYAEARLLARKYLKEAMKNPTSIAHLVNSQFYLYQRQHEEAISELQRALILDPNNPLCNASLGSALFLGGRPQEAVDFINRAIRLDPVNPARYLYLLGGAQFCMGNLEEAASLVEKGIRLNPELTGSAGWLLATYGLLGRDKEASAAMDIYKKGKAGEFYIREVMYFFPFKDRTVADRFAEGLSKAGVKGRPSEYLPAFKENQLSGDQVKKLLFGSTIIGIVPDGRQWSAERKENGAITYRGPGPISADVGKNWTEGDVLCQQYEKRFWGLEFFSTVFRNPKGTYEGKDEYFLCSDIAFSPFSVVR